MLKSKIAIIILNYKVKELTLKCVESVKATIKIDPVIIVVDNDSKDNLINELPKDVIFIQNKSNIGYSGGNNVGIRRALELDVEYIFILNPDTLVDPKALDYLIKAFDNEKVGIVGPKILFSDKKTIWYAGGEFDLLNVLGNHKGVDQIDYGQYNKATETDFVSGAAIMIKKTVFEKIGLFDEKYFLYYEDADICYRAKQADYKIMYIPQAVVYHDNAKSTGLGSSLQDYYITRNRLLFASKFLPVRTQFALIREAAKHFFYPMRRLALVDFLIGNFGQGSITIK